MLKDRSTPLICSDYTGSLSHSRFSLLLGLRGKAGCV